MFQNNSPSYYFYGYDLAKSKYADKTKWIIKAKKVSLMMTILPSEVGGDG